jgi:hypothetical protein
MIKRTLPQFLLAGLLLFLNYGVFAQQRAGSATRYDVKQAPLLQVVDLSEPATQWMFNVQNLDVRHYGSKDMDSIKQVQLQRKREWEISGSVAPELYKQAAARPEVGDSYKGNNPDGGVPNDNTIAISNSGTVVSAVNSNITMYTSSGALLKSVSLYDFTQNSALNSIYFDPRVQYDPVADRYIIVYLHGSTPTTSKVVVGFSRSNNPASAWNLYTLEGDAFLGNNWVDYPNIGITQNELFITGSLFNTNKDYVEPVIWQIEKQTGYNGASLNFQLWGSIVDAIGNVPFTLVPMSSGNSTHTGPGMYFLSTESRGGDRVNMFRITNEISASNETLTSNAILVADYAPPGSAGMKGTLITLNTGDCRVKNGFILNGILHFVFASDFSNGFSGVNYGRVNVSDQTIQMASFGTTGLDYCYPSVAWFGTDVNDKSVVINFLSSGKTIFPEVRVVNCDNDLNYSQQMLIRGGDNFFQVITGEQRWGDYTGIASRFNASMPTVWVAGGYPQIDKKYGNWIAELTPGTPTNVEKPVRVKMEAALFPNPATKLFNLRFTLPQADEISISLHDMSGRVVKTFFSDRLKAGLNQLSFNEEALSPGIYFLQISNESELLMNEKLVISR